MGFSEKGVGLLQRPDYGSSQGQSLDRLVLYQPVLYQGLCFIGWCFIGSCIRSGALSIAGAYHCASVAVGTLPRQPMLCCGLDLPWIFCVGCNNALLCVSRGARLPGAKAFTWQSTVRAYRESQYAWSQC